MITKLKNLKNNKKGASTIELGIGAIIIILLLVFAIDIALFVWKFTAVSEVSSYIARTTSLQGGTLNQAPNNYSDMSQYYVKSDVMYGNVRKMFEKVGVADGDFVIKINDKTFTGHPTSKFDYQDIIVVDVVMTYDWTFSKHVLPMKSSTIGSSKATVSEYKYSYGTWDDLRE